jgi:energy-coupling factor transport system ATP-binding protein
MNISVESVSFQYPNGMRALEDIRLQIQAGEQVAWIGANGAGKSTLARLLNGLLRPQQGRISIGDWKTSDHRVNELARRVGYVFQNPDEQLFARTLREEVAFGPRNLGLPAAQVEAAVETALGAVDLMDRAAINPYDLHPARRKELGLATILAMDPKILILDEPTTGQDAHGLDRLGRVLADWRRRGRTVILITHDMEFCSEHADRVVVFSQGRILIDGTSHEVFAQSDLLPRAQIDPPQLARLARALGLPGMPTDVEAFLMLWRDGKDQTIAS